MIARPLLVLVLPRIPWGVDSTSDRIDHPSRPAQQPHRMPVVRNAAEVFERLEADRVDAIVSDEALLAMAGTAFLPGFSAGANVSPFVEDSLREPLALLLDHGSIQTPERTPRGLAVPLRNALATHEASCPNTAPRHNPRSSSGMRWPRISRQCPCSIHSGRSSSFSRGGSVATRPS